jgi:hypothetical protein
VSGKLSKIPITFKNFRESHIKFSVELEEAKNIMQHGFCPFVPIIKI